MNIQTTLNGKMEELCHRAPEPHPLLDKILKEKGHKGNYTLGRHKLPEPDIKTVLKEIQQVRETE